VPGKPITPKKPLVYLDWSTLVYAFDGTSDSARDVRRNLSRTVVDISAKANLCLSFTHICELTHNRDAVGRAAMARWLDGLDAVWLRSESEVEVAELRHALVCAATGTRVPPPVPAVPSFLSMWGEALRGEALEYALANPTLDALVELIASEPRLMTRLEQGMRGGSIAAAKQLYLDRKAAFGSVGEAAMNADLDRRFRKRLESDALAMAGHLRGDANSGLYVERDGLHVPPTDDELRARIGGALDVTVMPYTYLAQRFIRSAAKDVLGRPNVNTKAFDEQRGDFYDIEHLVGAAYCDLFTCDQRTEQRLANGRALIGRGLPITAAGGLERLNERIASQLAG